MAKCVKIKESEDKEHKGRFTLYFSVQKANTDTLEGFLQANSAVQTLYAYTIENENFTLEQLEEKFKDKDVAINCYDFTTKELCGYDVLEWTDNEDLSPMSSRHIATFASRSEAKEAEATRLKRGIALKIWTIPTEKKEEGSED